MKINLIIDESVDEDEITIVCSSYGDDIKLIHQSLMSSTKQAASIIYYKDLTEYMIELSDVLFFETEADCVYAHTCNDAYLVKKRIYELEQMLPMEFVRVSKSTILNVRHIYSIDRSIASSSLVRLKKTHKYVYVSRRYYKVLKESLEKRRLR